MDHLVGVLIAVVLIGDVDVGTGLDVAADVDGEVTDDVAPAADHGAIADADHRVGDHLLSRDHAGRQADVGTDQAVLADVDPLLAEDGSRREGQAAAAAERAELVGQGVARTSGSVADHPVPSPMDQGVEEAVAQPAHVALRGDPRVRG